MKHQVLGVQIDAVTEGEALDCITAFAREGGAHQVVTANPEILDNASRNASLRALINRAALVTADGQGVLLAGRILGTPFPARVTGIELAEALCKESARRDLALYFLGAEPGVVDEAAANMRAKYPGVCIVGTHHGYFRNEGPAAVIADIKQAAPDVLLVGMGSPYQEHFIDEHLAATGAKVGIGVGGSFDVLSGRVERAPEIFIRLKLEWLYRIASDRKRWKRALALPRFVIKVLRQKFHI
ncbi:MAG: WecB/TagA/CpsF family glycosyltransferase [Peptococcaceae bacterium]|nr:WecB/TagA/CpsF family glycosyltransferase [Peptococcaceae bacterium]